MLENKLIDVWNLDNLQDHMLLLKSTVDYMIKTEAFEQLLYQTTLDKANEFSVKQLEIVVWALSKRLTESNVPGQGI